MTHILLGTYYEQCLVYLVQSDLIKLDRSASQAYVWHKSLFDGLHQQGKPYLQAADHSDIAMPRRTFPSFATAW